MDVISQSYLPGDPVLVDKIVNELKSQGIFDQFRKECISDVDTKPAYQNLRQRVEGSVAGFLRKQTWKPDMNKNQVREMLRKNIQESGFLETGVERIVDQVVNPKINSIFQPKVTEVVYKFLGLEKPKEENKMNILQKLQITTESLLPTDLEAVSPDSVASDKKYNKSTDSHSLNDSKIDEDESPPFELIEQANSFTHGEENSIDSHLSGFSGLISHDSNHSHTKPLEMDISNQDSKMSFEGRLSIAMSEDTNSKMEICEDSMHSKSDDGIKHFDFGLDSSDKSSASSKFDRKDDRKDERAEKDDRKDKESNMDMIETRVNEEGGTTEERKDDEGRRNDEHRWNIEEKRYDEDKIDGEEIFGREEQKDQENKVERTDIEERKDKDEKKDKEERKEDRKDRDEKDKEDRKESRKEDDWKVRDERKDREDDKRYRDDKKDRSDRRDRDDKKERDDRKDRGDRKDKDDRKDRDRKDKARKETKDDRRDKEKSGDKSKSDDRRSDKSKYDKSRSESRSERKDDKRSDRDKYKSKDSKDRERDRSRDKNESRSRNDKDRNDKNERSNKDRSDKDKNDRERNNRDKSDRERTDRERSDKERNDRERSDRDRSNREKGDRDKSERDKNDKEKYDKDRKGSRYSSSKKDGYSKGETSSGSKERSSSKDKMKSSSSSTSLKDFKRDDRSKGDYRSTSRTDSKSNSYKKDEKKSGSSSNKDSRSKDKKDSKKDNKKESKDDHFSVKGKRSDRRSTDRDSNDGHCGNRSSSTSRSDSTSSSQQQSKNQDSSMDSSNSGSGSTDSGNSDVVETECAVTEDVNMEICVPASNQQMGPIKWIIPKVASNIHEARRLMKIRKKLQKLEKQGNIDMNKIRNKLIEEHVLSSDEAFKENKHKNIIRKTTNASSKPATKIDLPGVKSKDIEQEKEVSSSVPSPPLQSAVVSAASWDEIEAQLNKNIDYDSYVDYSEYSEDQPIDISFNVNLSKESKEFSVTSQGGASNVDQSSIANMECVNTVESGKFEQGQVQCKEHVESVCIESEDSNVKSGNCDGFADGSTTEVRSESNQVQHDDETRGKVENVRLIEETVKYEEEIYRYDEQILMNEERIRREKHKICFEDQAYANEDNVVLEERSTSELSAAMSKEHLTETNFIEPNSKQNNLLYKKDNLTYKKDTYKEHNPTSKEDILTCKEDNIICTEDNLTLKDHPTFKENNPMYKEDNPTIKTDDTDFKYGETSIYIQQKSNDQIDTVTDEHNCLYFSPDILPQTERYQAVISKLIKHLESDIMMSSLLVPRVHLSPLKLTKAVGNDSSPSDTDSSITSDKIGDVGTRGIKRRLALDEQSDVHNNNKRNNCHIEATHDDKFPLPLSPAESDKSVDVKILKNNCIAKGSTASKRYSSDDLYKPRPVIRSSRRRGKLSAD